MRICFGCIRRSTLVSRRRQSILLLTCIVIFVLYNTVTPVCPPSGCTRQPLSNFKDPALQDAVNSDHNDNTEYVVPNIVHYIWFTKNHKKSFLFLHYVSIVSAYRQQQPDIIWFHCNHFPSGPWWDHLWRVVPTLKVIYREPPEEIYGQRLAHYYHRADVGKMEILLKYGGIYLDYDVIVLKNLTELRRYDTTVGEEKAKRLNFGVVVARPNATFLRLLHESYRNNYRADDWDYNCAVVAYDIYQKNKNIVHVERRRLTTPDWLDRHLLWNETIDWSDLLVLHVLGQVKTPFSPDNIRLLNSTFGEVMRFAYYGSPSIVSQEPTARPRRRGRKKV